MWAKHREHIKQGRQATHVVIERAIGTMEDEGDEGTAATAIPAVEDKDAAAATAMEDFDSEDAAATTPPRRGL